MSARRRRRGVVLLALALVSGGLAASRVRGRERELEERVGPAVPVVVAARDLPAGRRLDGGLLALRRVPARFVPPDALASPEEATRLRTAVALARGSYVTAGELASRRGGDAGGPAPLGRGQRPLQVTVAGAEGVEGPGSRVDVLVTTDPRSGRGRTYLALEDVQLLGLRAAGDQTSASGARGAVLATLRVSVRQAVFLTAAQNYAQELRLLPRAPGDRARVGHPGVAAGAL